MKQVLTMELAKQLDNAEVAVLQSRLSGIQSQSGNPMGVEMKKFGHATAFTVKGIPGPSYNTVKGITGEDIDVVEQILDFYKARNLPAQFEITPVNSTPQLLQILREHGFYHSEFHTSLYGCNEDLHIVDHPLVSVRALEEAEFKLFAKLYVKGFSMPDVLLDYVAKNNRVLYNNRSWRFYLAAVDGEAAGIGVLFIADGVATLAASATIPEFRNKGIHRALISKRIEEARQLGCHTIAGQATFGSVSHTNMEKVGMRVAYTKAIWKKENVV